MMENENQVPATGGSSKLSTIFIVVLALHIVIIMVIGAYHLVKGNQNPVVAEEQAPQQENTVNGFENEPTETAKTENNEAALTAPVIERGAVDMANQGIQLNEQQQQQPAQPAVQQVPVASAPVLDNKPVAARPEPKLITDQAKTAQVAKQTVSAAAPIATTQPVGSYKVAKGDTLSKIARNNKTTVKQLRELNNLKNDNLKIGQALKVPGASSVTEVAKAAPVIAPAAKAQPVASAPMASSNNANVKVYEVVKGDTLMKIARNHKTTAKAIADLNGVQDPTKIKVGTKLKIPSNELQASTPAAQNENAQAASEVQQINMRPVGGSDMAMLRQPENL
jgi:membrane-bound lytic murein transglycosylase D